MEYRSLTDRESVYLNEEEANLIKRSLYLSMTYESADIRDMICELVCVMNGCISENRAREARMAETYEE